MSSQPTLISQAEVEDWFENPITQLFFSTLDQISEYVDRNKRDCFAPGQPYVTHEQLSWHLGAEWALGQLADMRDDKTIRGVADEE